MNDFWPIYEWMLQNNPYAIDKVSGYPSLLGAPASSYGLSNTSNINTKGILDTAPKIGTNLDYLEAPTQSKVQLWLKANKQNLQNAGKAAAKGVASALNPALQKWIGGDYDDRGIGKGIAGVGNTAGQIIGGIPGLEWLGAGVSLGSGVLGGTLQRFIGTDWNEQGIANSQKITANNRMYGRGLGSTNVAADVINASGNIRNQNLALSDVGKKGVLSTGTRLNNRFNKLNNAANSSYAYATNAFINAAHNVDRTTDDIAEMNSGKYGTSYAAYGGLLNKTNNKFEDGGDIPVPNSPVSGNAPDMSWHNWWLGNRAGILGNNVISSTPKEMLPQNFNVEDLGRKEVAKQIDNAKNFTEYVGPDLPESTYGVLRNAYSANTNEKAFKKFRKDARGIIFHKSGNIVYPSTPDSSTFTHERTHALTNTWTPQEGKIYDLMDDNSRKVLRNPPLLVSNYDPYWDKPSEIYARLMGFRQKYGLDPTKTVTQEDLDNWRKLKYDRSIGGINLLNRYKDDFLLKLFNEVADDTLPDNNYIDSIYTNNITPEVNMGAYGGLLNMGDGAVDYGFKMDFLNHLNNKDKASNKIGISSMGGTLFNPFGLGGVMQSHGADWGTGATHIDAGGTHEMNPNEGVPMGMDNEGTPNVVEEGEVIVNDYVFSDRIYCDADTKKTFHIGKKRKITFADQAKKLEKEIAERPNDPISKASFNRQIAKLQEQQERQKEEAEKAKEDVALDQMTPEEKTAYIQQMNAEQQAMQQQPSEEEMMAQQQMQGIPQQMPQQASPEEIAQQQMMAQQMPQMAAYGGPLKKKSKGPIKKKFKDWYSTVPIDRNDTKDYNLERAYEVLPLETLERWREYQGPEEGAPHLPTVYYNEDADEYEFLKSSNHPTLNEELKWYNSNDPRAIDFRNNYELDTSEPYYKYVRRNKKNSSQTFGDQLNRYAMGGKINKFGDGGFEKWKEKHALNLVDPDIYKKVTRLAEIDPEYFDSEEDISVQDAIDYADRYWDGLTEDRMYDLYKSSINKMNSNQELQSSDVDLNASQDIITNTDPSKLLSKIYEAIGDIYSRSGFDRWAEKNKVINYSLDHPEELLKNQSFLDAIKTTNSSLSHVLGSGYDFGIGALPDAETIVDLNTGGSWSPKSNLSWYNNWDAEGNVSRQDAAWKEAIEKGLITPDMDRATIGKNLMKTDAWQNTTKLLKENADYRLKYLLAIANGDDNYVSPKAKEWANQFVDAANGTWKKGYETDDKNAYDITLKKQRETNAGNYWKTLRPQYLNSTVKNWIQNEDGSWELMDVAPPADWKPTTYNWNTKDGKITHNYYIDPNSKAGKEAAKKEAEAKRNVVPRLRNEAARYVGLLGPAVGLGLWAAGVGKPDFTDLDRAVANTGRAHLAGYQPIAEPYKYQPQDTFFPSIGNAGIYAAANRNIMNTAAPSGTINAGLINSAYNAATNNGDLALKVAAANDERARQKANYDLAWMGTNAAAHNATSQFNAHALNQAENVRNNAAIMAANQKMDAKAGWYNSLYGNVNNLFKGIADYGREQADYNMLARLAATSALGKMSPENAMGSGFLYYEDEEPDKNKKYREGKWFNGLV